MPMQQQNSSLAKKLGGRIAEAQAEHAAKPVDVGNRRLPSGIKNGVAKLSSVYTKDYETGKSPGPPKKPGEAEETFFRASAVVMFPKEHGGMKVAGLVTSLIIPICDIPAKKGDGYETKGSTLSDNWYKFQNFFKMFLPNVAPCQENKATDPTGERTNAYYQALMANVTERIKLGKDPIYVSFSTRGFIPKATLQKPKPDEIVYEEWHGIADAALLGQFNPAGGIVDSLPPNPPTQGADGLPVEPQTANQRGASPPPPSGPPPQHQPPQEPEDKEDYIAALVESAMADPNDTSVTSQLEKLAWDAGWSKEQTTEAEDWAQVGDMALNPPDADTPSEGNAPAPAVTIGSRWMYAKRDKSGVKLKNKNGEEFPPFEVEVAAVDTDTCTLKAVKDGKEVTDIRKKPLAVKFEWLEPLK